MATAGAMTTPSRKPMQQQDQASAAELERARAFITRCRWTFAASLPEHPHEYVARRWLSTEDQGTFDWLVGLIARHGYAGTFWGARWSYLDLDGRAYWSSQSWYGPDARKPATMLNRRRLDDGQLRLETER
jgi:hypothetical protein